MTHAKFSLQAGFFAAAALMIFSLGAQAMETTIPAEPGAQKRFMNLPQRTHAITRTRTAKMEAPLSTVSTPKAVTADTRFYPVKSSFYQRPSASARVKQARHEPQQPSSEETNKLLLYVYDELR